MKYFTIKGTERYIKEHQKTKHRRWVITGLALMVVFCTVYSMILPALTMEKGVCEISEHSHSEACYGDTGELTCGLEEHTHSEACQSTEKAPEQGNLNMILPVGAQIPDGYDANYSYIDPENRFGVMVYATEGALPDNAVLSAQLLEQGSGDYEAAQQALTDTAFDGFAALDIHFTVDGEEIEPESSVYVCLNVMGLLPENADKKSLAVQHHEQTGTALPKTDGKEPAGAVTVATVADATEETGQVEALDNGTEITADVAATFEVESFSTFTITWEQSTGSNYVLNLHYVDTAGNDIAPSGSNVVNLATVQNGVSVTMQDYADKIDHTGYVYQHTHVNNSGTKTAVNLISYKDSKWKYTTNTYNNNWTELPNSGGKTSLEVYLVYQQIDTDSTVKVTWHNGAYALYLHYVDTDGNPLQIDTGKTYQDSVPDKLNILVSNYSSLLYSSESYTYKKAYISSNNEDVDVELISYNYTSWGYMGVWCYTPKTSENSWYSWADETGNKLYSTYKAVDAYLVFEKNSDAYYYAQPVHDDIKLTLYDYGSYINTGADHIIPFSQAAGLIYSSIDGNPVDIKDGSVIGKDNLTYPPTMKPTLNSNGNPVVLVNKDGNSSEYDLDYLFRKGDAPLNTGSATPPLTDYANMRTKATWNATDGYRTQYESMRFDLGNDGGLFHVDEEGYYIYRAEEQSAYYNQSTNRFELSDTLIDVGHKTWTASNFLPFDKINPSLGGKFTQHTTVDGIQKPLYRLPYSKTEDKSSGIADLWFGMTMEVDFYMPVSGKVNGKDMVFEFYGDDDVWVYIDDVLVLDIGGCHSSRNGSINFATGSVSYPNPEDDGNTTINTTLKTLFTNAGVNTTSFGDSNNTFIDWTRHKLKFFYMERGGNISYCQLKFNMPTQPEKSLQVAKTLTANKDTDADVVKHLENTMEYKYRVVKADASGNPTNQLLIKEGDSYTISGVGLTSSETRMVGAGGYFTLKAGQMAEFTNMLARFDENDSVKKYVVQEVLPTNYNGQYNDVVYSAGETSGTCKNNTTIVETNFTGYNSPAQYAENNNLIRYTNKVATEKLSTLEITKKQEGSSPNGPRTYYMKVQLGPDKNSLEPISVGTPYVVGNVTRYVEQAGIIKIAAGETAKVRLLAGTHYSVVEVADKNGTALTGNEEYTPTYSDNAGGTITNVNTTVKITVTNTFPQGNLKLSKTVRNISNRNDTSGNFTFKLSFPVGNNWVSESFPLTGVNGQSDLTFVKEGTNAVANVTLQHNQTITVSGLPDVKMTVTETNTDGYAVSWTIGGKDQYVNPVTVDIVNNATVSVACTNQTGYELPATGGFGTTLYTTGGLALIFGGAILLYIHKRRRKAGNINYY